MLTPYRFYSRRALNEWLYVGLVLWLFGGYIAYSLYQDHNHTGQQEQERLTTQARVVAENLERQLQSTNLALTSVLRELPKWHRDGAKPAGQYLKALTDAMPGVLTMLVIDSQGAITAADKPELIGQNVAYREYFKTVQRYPNPKTLYVSVPFLTAKGIFTMNLVRMVAKPDGSFDGMVIAALDPEDFKVLLSSVLYTPDMHASLIHGDGMLFLTVPARKELLGFDQGKPDSFFSLHLQSKQKANVFSGTRYPMVDENMIAMVTVQPAELLMDNPLVITVGRKSAAIFADWQHEASKHAALFCVAALTALLGLIYYQKQWQALDAEATASKAELQQTLETLRVSEEQFRSLTRLSSDWYWEQDEHFRFVRLHGKLDQRTSIANEAHVGNTRWEMGALNLTEADWEAHRAELQAHKEFHNFVMQRRDRKGQMHWVSISGAPIFDVKGKFTGYRGIARDITLEKSAEDEIKRLAFYDSLTQLANRRLFNDRLGHAFAASNRSKRHGALMFLDLDNFKPLNDLHGHQVGDLLLIEVARRIKECLREVDTVARFGGDEFAVIISELDEDWSASQAKAAVVAEKIHAGLAEPYVLSHPTDEDSANTVTHRCTASIGVVLFSDHMVTQKEVVMWADAAMYQAKEAGRNLIRFHEQKNSLNS